MNMYVHGKEMPEKDDEGNSFTYVDLATRAFEETGRIGHEFTPGSPVGKYTVADQQHNHSVAERWSIIRLGVDVYQMKQVEGPRRELPRIHELKIDQHNLSALLSGRKKCEIRDNDRDFKTGEFLFLRETQRTNIEMKAHGLPLNYTGRVALFEITHIQTGYGLPSWLVAMSVNELARAF